MPATRTRERPLAPAPSELEVLLTDAEIDAQAQIMGDAQGADPALNQVFDGVGFLDSQRRKVSGRDYVDVQRTSSPMRTLYDLTGQDRAVAINDVAGLIDARLPEQQRLYLHCPLCAGQHASRGPNACPERPPRKWMRCPICTAHGREHRVYEDQPVDPAGIVSEGDEYMVAPKLPDMRTREARLQGKLEEHMMAFHAGEARSQYGLRKTVTVQADR